MSKISTLQNANKAKKAQVRTLKIYKQKFNTKKSNFKDIYLKDKDICNSTTFWRGEIYKDFKELAEDGLRAEGKNYYYSFDNVKSQIADKISSVEKEIANNNDEIKRLMIAQKG